MRDDETDVLEVAQLSGHLCGREVEVVGQRPSSYWTFGERQRGAHLPDGPAAPDNAGLVPPPGSARRFAD